eukprot:164279-Amphidinium_carterae.1
MKLLSVPVAWPQGTHCPLLLYRVDVPTQFNWNNRENAQQRNTPETRARTHQTHDSSYVIV